MDIEQTKASLLAKYPLFGSVLANSKIIAQESIGTAGTDGKNIYYNPNFVESITKEEQVFVIAHEICHIAFNHIKRSEDKDKEIWNIATDSVINAFLKQDGLPIVTGGVDIPEAINYDSEEMYNKLLKEKQSNNKLDQNESNKDLDVGHDTHSMWDKIKKEEQIKSETKKSSEKGMSILDRIRKIFNNKNYQNQEIEEKTHIEHNETKEFVELGEKEIFKKNRIEKKKKLEELKKKIEQQAHGYNEELNTELINVTNIGMSKQIIDWRKLLRDAIHYEGDWSYQNAGIEDGVITPYLEQTPKVETEIILDTSGSIDEELLKSFLRECKNIIRTSKVKVGCFDTKFYGFNDIKSISDIENIKFYGGGFTNFDIAINSFTPRADNKIIFTDGCASMPHKSLDVIWVVFGDRKINPPGGRVIYIGDKQLNDLYDSQNRYQINGRTK